MIAGWLAERARFALWVAGFAITTPASPPKNATTDRPIAAIFTRSKAALLSRRLTGRFPVVLFIGASERLGLLLIERLRQPRRELTIIIPATTAETIPATPTATTRKQLNLLIGLLKRGVGLL